MGRQIIKSPTGSDIKGSVDHQEISGLVFIESHPGKISQYWIPHDELVASHSWKITQNGSTLLEFDYS